jgi:hypothetical protein
MMFDGILLQMNLPPTKATFVFLANSSITGLRILCQFIIFLASVSIKMIADFTHDITGYLHFVFSSWCDSYGFTTYSARCKGPFELLYVSSRDKVNNLESMAVTIGKRN